MSKRELIDRIQHLNPTARSEFLAQFPEHDLSEYLDHLIEAMLAPRPTEARIERSRPISEIPIASAPAEVLEDAGEDEEQPATADQLALAF